MTDESSIRLSELEVQIEELEKTVGKLSAQVAQQDELLNQAMDYIEGLQDDHRALLHRTTQISEHLGEAEDSLDRLDDTVQELSKDLDDTIEDMNLLSGEMRRRWQRLLTKHEQLLWDLSAQNRFPAPKKGAEPPEDPEDEDDEDGEDEE